MLREQKEKNQRNTIAPRYSVSITWVLISSSRFPKPTTLDLLSPFHTHAWQLLGPFFLRCSEEKNEFLVTAWPHKDGELWCRGAVWLGRRELLTHSSVNAKPSTRWWKPSKVVYLNLASISRSFQVETMYPLLAQPNTFFGKFHLFR